MKRAVLIIFLSFITFSVFGQNFVSRKQHTTTISNEYRMNRFNLYFTINEDTIVNTDRKLKKFYDTYIVGDTIQDGDRKIKWDIVRSRVGNIKGIKYKGIDTFTGRSFQILYDLIPRKD